MAVSTLKILQDTAYSNNGNRSWGLNEITNVTLNTAQRAIVVAEVGAERTNPNDPDFSALEDFAFFTDDGLTDDEFVLDNTPFEDLPNE